MTRSWDLVMFDLDGTLLDTAPEIAGVVSRVLRAMNRREPPPERVRGWIGCGARVLMRRALAWADGVGEESIDAAVLSQATHRYAAIHEQRVGENSHPFPGALDCLRALAAQGTRLAVVSNKERRLAELLLVRHGLRPYVELVIGGDSLPAKKPDALPLRHCLQVFGVDASRALFVGDSALDAECARNAGVACWIVDYGYDERAAIEREQPARLIDGLERIAS